MRRCAVLEGVCTYVCACVLAMCVFYSNFTLPRSRKHRYRNLLNSRFSFAGRRRVVFISMKSFAFYANDAHISCFKVWRGVDIALSRIGAIFKQRPKSCETVKI